MSRVQIFGIIFLFFLPLTFAFDCSRLDNKYQTDCTMISNSNATDSASIIINLPYENSELPMHDYVKSWNEKIVFGNAPENIKTITQTFIKNAWLKIVSVMPSVILNDTLFIPKNTKVIAGYNHNTILPDDYYSTQYPDNSNGDCKRIYRLNSDNTQVNYYVNNILQSQNVVLNDDSEIRAELSIIASVNIDHYKWKRYCSRRDKNGNCVSYSYRCTYLSSEIQTDTVNLQDTVKVTYYNQMAVADLKVINNISNEIKAVVTVSDFGLFDFGNSYYQFAKYSFSLTYDYKPYYVLTIKAIETNQETIDNITKSGDYIYINNPTGCTAYSSDLFTQSESACNFSFQNYNIELQTDKLIYKDGEKVEVKITPNDKQISVSYANETLLSKQSAEFIAITGQNMIVASIGELTAQRIIFVHNETALNYVLKIVAFVLTISFAVLVVRKTWKRN